MRWTIPALLLCLTFGFVGCDKPAESVPSVEPPASSGTTDAEPADDDSAAVETPAIRFVADTKFEVPNMECPYSCYPKVKETLAALPGVESVQLAEQPEGTAEGVIETKVVELKLNGDFDADAAVAALKQESFDASVLN